MTAAWSATTHYHAGDTVTNGGKTWRAEHASLNDVPPGRSWEEVVSGVALARMVRIVGASGFPLNPGTFTQVAWDTEADASGDITYTPGTKRFKVNTDGVYALTASLFPRGDTGDPQRAELTVGVVQPEGGDRVYEAPQANQLMDGNASASLVMIDWFAAGTELVVDAVIYGTAAHYSLNGSAATLVRLT